MEQLHFNQIGLLITHYNRSTSLERLLSELQNLKLSFSQIIVSDDGSKPEHLEQLNRMVDLYGIDLVTTDTNKGLGNNINKGQDRITADFTLYLQEDFVPTEIFRTALNNGLIFLEQRNDLDIIRFYAFSSYPLLKKYQKGFSEMYYSNWSLNHLKFFYYSDHPHLRRKNFFEKFGRYDEGKKGDITEFNMCLSFIKNGGKGLFYTEYKSLFGHANTEDEPTTMDRVYWRHKKNFFILFLREVYLFFRLIKNTVQLMLTSKRDGAINS